MPPRLVAAPRIPSTRLTPAPVRPVRVYLARRATATAGELRDAGAVSLELLLVRRLPPGRRVAVVVRRFAGGPGTFHLTGVVVASRDRLAGRWRAVVRLDAPLSADQLAALRGPPPADAGG